MNTNIFKKLNKKAIFAGIVILISFTFFPSLFAHAQSYGSGYSDYYDTSSYGSGYSDYYDTSSYGSGYSNYYDTSSYGSGYSDYYDTSSYGSGYAYDYGYNTDTNYFSSYDSYYVDDTCYDCGGSYYDTYYSYGGTCSSCGSSYGFATYPGYYSSNNYSYQNNYNYNNNNNTSLSLSCYPDRSTADTNTNVHWYAIASGGNGNYSYSWSGTDGLSGSGSSINQSYGASGSKTATVTVTSGGYTRTANCGSVYINNYNNDNGSLGVSCSISDTNVAVGESVHVYANGYGGNGNYTYSWSGAYPLSGRSGSDQNYSYDSTGSKDVTVTVYSNGYSATRNCGTVYVGGSGYYSGYNNYYYNGNLNISCTVNKTNVALGEIANWTTTVSGGNGNYTYVWNGTDSLYGYSPTMAKSYSTTGSKTATVTVTSNGYTRSLACPTVVVGGVAPTGNLASLSSVYLNQVPYTGAGDNIKLVAFLSGLVLWSAIAAYFVMKRKATLDRKNAINAFKQGNLARRLGK